MAGYSKTPGKTCYGDRVKMGKVMSKDHGKVMVKMSGKVKQKGK